MIVCSIFLFFFFNDTATTEIYTLSLHDALPIFVSCTPSTSPTSLGTPRVRSKSVLLRPARSEEHTSELQSRQYLVCRLLLEKKKKHKTRLTNLSRLPSPKLHDTARST